MSDWDEKADEAAVRHHTFESMTGEDNERIRYGFWNGAKWQREQLRTDEAVEGAAEAIYRSHDSYTHFTAKPWAEMVKSKDRANKFRVKQDRKAARAAIDALLEQEPRP